MANQALNLMKISWIGMLSYWLVIIIIVLATPSMYDSMFLSGIVLILFFVFYIITNMQTIRLAAQQARWRFGLINLMKVHQIPEKSLDP